MRKQTAIHIHPLSVPAGYQEYIRECRGSGVVISLKKPLIADLEENEDSMTNVLAGDGSRRGGGDNCRGGSDLKGNL